LLLPSLYNVPAELYPFELENGS